MSVVSVGEASFITGWLHQHHVGFAQARTCQQCSKLRRHQTGHIYTLKSYAVVWNSNFPDEAVFVVGLCFLQSFVR